MSMDKWVTILMGRQRKLILDALSEQMVAYGNAWQLIPGTPWGG